MAADVNEKENARKMRICLTSLQPWLCAGFHGDVTKLVSLVATKFDKREASRSHPLAYRRRNLCFSPFHPLVNTQRMSLMIREIAFSVDPYPVSPSFLLPWDLPAPNAGL
jgi:hypothetical protein